MLAATIFACAAIQPSHVIQLLENSCSILTRELTCHLYTKAIDITVPNDANLSDATEVIIPVVDHLGSSS